MEELWDMILKNFKMEALFGNEEQHEECIMKQCKNYFNSSPNLDWDDVLTDGWDVSEAFVYPNPEGR